MSELQVSKNLRQSQHIRKIDVTNNREAKRNKVVGQNKFFSRSPLDATKEDQSRHDRRSDLRSAVQKHGEDSPVSQYVGELNCAVNSKNTARKASGVAKKERRGAITSLFEDNQWSTKQIQDTEIKRKLGITDPSRTYKDEHTHLSKNLKKTQTDRTQAYDDFAQSVSFNRNSTNKERFEEPHKVMKPDGTMGYKMVTGNGKTRMLTPSEQKKYEDLLKARTEHEEVKTKLGILEEHIVESSTTEKPNDSNTGNALTKAHEELIQKQEAEKRAKEHAYGYFDENGVPLTKEEYAARPQQTPTNDAPDNKDKTLDENGILSLRQNENDLKNINGKKFTIKDVEGITEITPFDSEGKPTKEFLALSGEDQQKISAQIVKQEVSAPKRFWNWLRYVGSVEDPEKTSWGAVAGRTLLFAPIIAWIASLFNQNNQQPAPPAR